MKCLRCGYCCKHYLVIIVDAPEKGIVEGNLTHHLGDGSPCKHLLGEAPGEFSCAVHNYDWYPETPCFNHGQIEPSPETPCRMGEFILKKYHKELRERDAEIIDLKRIIWAQREKDKTKGNK